MIGERLQFSDSPEGNESLAIASVYQIQGKFIPSLAAHQSRDARSNEEHKHIMLSGFPDRAVKLRNSSVMVIFRHVMLLPRLLTETEPIRSSSDAD
ncbi:MAG: hypothetical protein WC976_01140 [Caldisericia bacterium]